MEKNASIHFWFQSEDYPNVDLTFDCNEDLSFDELVGFFRKFAFAMSYHPNTIDKYLGEEE